MLAAIFRPNHAVQINLARVARQSLAALLLVLLLAGYGVSHPATYTTLTPPSTIVSAR